MPNYTTSYSTKNKPRYRKNTNGRLSGARKPPRRRDAQYLRRTQGFGGRRRSGHGYGGNDRRPYAIIVVGCAFLLFVASIVWYANRSVEISIERVIREKELEPRPGNLLAVDDSVLEKGGGTACTVELNGKAIDNDRLGEVELAGGEKLEVGDGKDIYEKQGNLLAVDDSVLEKGGGTACTVELNGKAIDNDRLGEVELAGGEKLEVGDGKDIYEKHDVEATAIEPTLTVDGTGPLRFVQTWGVPGRSEVWTGKTTGIVADKGVVEDVVNAEVTCTTITPDIKGKKYIALTFDEGPSSRTSEILDILKEKDAKATFFVSGDKVAAVPAAVKAIAESGNELGTNAYSDVNLGELSASDLRSQLSDSFAAVKKAGGGKVSLVRPPFGEFSEQNWADAMDMVSAVVSWNVDSKKAGGGKVSLVRPPFGEFSEQNWADAMDMVSAVVSWNVDSGDWLLPGAATAAERSRSCARRSASSPSRTGPMPWIW